MFDMRPIELSEMLIRLEQIYRLSKPALNVVLLTPVPNMSSVQILS